MMSEPYCKVMTSISRRQFLGFGAAAAIFPIAFGRKLPDIDSEERGVSNRGERQQRAMHDCLLYVGTYTEGKSKGIYAFRFSIEHGTLTQIGLVAEAVNPSFLALHPSRKFLYAIGEVKQYEGQPSGFVSAYSIHSDTGALSLLGRVSSHGAGPCHVVVDKTGKFAIVSNYVGGSVAVFRILENGGLGEMTSLVQHLAEKTGRDSSCRPRAHGAFFSADNRFVVVPDLGLDKLFIYRFKQETGVLERADSPFVSLTAGAGPRHFAFHPSGKHGYSINEKDSTITAFEYDRSVARLLAFQSVSSLPANFRGENSTAEIQTDAEGKFLYASNRGADSIAVFAIAADGSLCLVEHVPTQGRTPRHFAIDPSGDWLIAANQDTDNVVIFRRNQRTGCLTLTRQLSDVGSPVCLMFVPVQ
jgi:6-phosphogluconolactonase